jgi:hypothetical protein
MDDAKLTLPPNMMKINMSAMDHGIENIPGSGYQMYGKGRYLIYSILMRCYSVVCQAQQSVPTCQHDEISNAVIDQAEQDERLSITLRVSRDLHSY